MMEPDAELWVGSRKITAEDIEVIRWTVRRFEALSRTELAATLCENLTWKAPNGRPKVTACMGLLERLARAGEISLPAQRGRPRAAAELERRGTAPPSPVIHTNLTALRPVRVDPVPAEEGPVWNAMMAEYHPLGFRRAFGAHQKYWVHDEATGRPRVLGGLLFAAAAKALAVRDTWIGWSAAERRRGLHRIVANSRYLLLPDVVVPHLASHVLALALRRLRGDWVSRYGFAPSVVETFVERRWAGTCYRAANWLYLGETAGRGRQDRAHANAVPIKAVWVYPLVSDWRARLVAAPEVVPDGELDA